MKKYWKRQLLSNLNSDTYCRLKPSKYSGVGVFAVKDIPIGVNPFKKAFTRRLSTIDISELDVKTLPAGVQTMISDFFQKDDKNVYSIPKYGLNDLDIAFYINHSSSPNVDIVDDGKSEFLEFRTNQPILEGEELTINYNKYNDFD